MNEKYVFALLFDRLHLGARDSAGNHSAAGAARGGDELAADWLGSCIGYIFAAWICVSIMLPIRLKFDSEKSRYANFIMIAVVFIAAFLVSSVIDYLPVSIVEAGKEWFYGLSAGGVLGIAGGNYSCCGHYFLSVQPHIMAKKEF